MPSHFNFKQSSGADQKDRVIALSGEKQGRRKVDRWLSTIRLWQSLPRMERQVMSMR